MGKNFYLHKPNQAWSILKERRTSKLEKRSPHLFSEVSGVGERKSKKKSKKNAVFSSDQDIHTKPMAIHLPRRLGIDDGGAIEIPVCLWTKHTSHFSRWNFPTVA